MSATASLLQTVVAGAANTPVFVLVRALITLTILAGLIMLFRPLLGGIARALVLVVRPHHSKAERVARAHMHDSEVVHTMINASSGPSDTAELRALASRD